MALTLDTTNVKLKNHKKQQHHAFYAVVKNTVVLEIVTPALYFRAVEDLTFLRP